MVRRKIGLVILLVLLVVPLVFALDTEITVKTKPNYQVTIRVLDIRPLEDRPLEERGKQTLEGGGFLNVDSGDSGELSVTFSSDTVNEIDISVMQRKNDILMKFLDGSPVKVFNNDGEHIKTGWSINIDLTVNPPVFSSKEPETNITEEGEAEEEENETIVEESEEEIVEKEKEDGKITGAVVDAGKTIFTSKTFYYIIGGVFILGVLFFIVFMAKKKLKGKKGHYVDFKIKRDKDDDKKEELDEKIETHDKRLEDAEKKLEEAKEELDDIKSRKSKLQEARERFERDKKELEKLEED